MPNQIKFALLLGACAVFAVGGASAQNFNIPGGELKAALDAYIKQAGVTVMYLPNSVKGVHTNGVEGDLSADNALARILSGTGFSTRRTASGAIGVVHDESSYDAPSMHIAAASAPTVPGAALETVTVTSSKIGGDVQNIPIAITALSQEQLTSRQIAGGPDLVKTVPNLTFSKTNFTGYNIQIRGIGTQAISVTTDPAVAVAFNDIPFIRNHFFEQEFYDVSQVEVLRGPQGTLYGRNATAGVVNLVSAKPSDQFEAMASLEIGNYGERRPEGMINIPIVDDRLDIRIAGEWTKRQGYSFNDVTNKRIDGRDLWSGRVTIGWKPMENLQAYFVWEHFNEDDDRIRSAKQLCKRDPGPTSIGGVPIDPSFGLTPQGYLSQGCLPTSLYGADAFQVVNAFSLPYYGGLTGIGQSASQYTPISVDAIIDPYANDRQPRNLRVIESALNPVYRAKSDVVEFNADYAVSPSLTLTSQTGFNNDFLWSTEDYNRFNTVPGIFAYDPGVFGTLITPDGYLCDPQLGCSNRLVAEDLSDEHAWQLSQEFRLASNFSGPFNFSVGANYLHYETEENYYVFFNTLTMWAASVRGLQNWIPGVSDNHECLIGGRFNPQIGYQNPDPKNPGGPLGCIYIDPNPITNLNNEGHNYFLSQNPYVLNSYATFGEVNYNILDDLKLTGGLRWTRDEKHFVDVPSELLVAGYGYPSTGVVNQDWGQWTGRLVANWSPKFDFTDQSLFYASYAHGYKAGGANPPGAVLLQYNARNGTEIANPVHPLTFKPEFVDAFELGTKNTLLDGAITLNSDLFYYNYENYQISEIVDRTAINLNFDSHVKGAELEASWEPLAGLKFGFAGGYEDARLAKGSQAVDLMDRTAGNPDWVVVKPFVTQASNCILPVYVLAVFFNRSIPIPADSKVAHACGHAYVAHEDPITELPYVANPTLINEGNDGHGGVLTGPADLNGYPGFDPSNPAINNGVGFDKNLSGNDLPNAPHYTTSLSAEYTMPITPDWATTLHSDFYWQADSFARVFNDRPYDELHGYSTVNLALIFTSQTGWQVMLFDKNILNTTAITGAFLNSDDTGLTTNVFLTDPKLIGVRVTKNW